MDLRLRHSKTHDSNEPSHFDVATRTCPEEINRPDNFRLLSFFFSFLFDININFDNLFALS